MRLVDLIPAPYRLLAQGVLLVALAGASAALAWQVQDWRYGRQLEQQARLQTETLNQRTLAAVAQQQAEQAKRLALEQRLSANEQTHYRALSDAQRDQGRLRDRLATADLRLSVLLDATAAASGRTVSATPSTGSMVHGPHKSPDLTQRMLNDYRHHRCR